MSATDGFLSLFDDRGHYRNGDGEIDVEFLTQRGMQYPGKLQFKGGLLVEAEMAGTSRWSYPDGSPLDGLKLLLHFPGERPRTLLVDRGQVLPPPEGQRPPSREPFLTNVRNARNLFVHSGVEASPTSIDEGSISNELRRGAIWITPRSVAGFDVAAFPELEPDELTELSKAVQEFEDVAKQVPADAIPSKEQYLKAAAAFLAILDILPRYVPSPAEPSKLEEALRSVPFPPWVVNWDYELDTSEDGEPAVRVTVFAEPNVPRSSYGRFSIQFGPIIRQALEAVGVHRWPYIRLRLTSEYKTA